MQQCLHLTTSTALTVNTIHIERGQYTNHGQEATQTVAPDACKVMLILKLVQETGGLTVLALHHYVLKIRKHCQAALLMCGYCLLDCFLPVNLDPKLLDNTPCKSFAETSLSEFKFCWPASLPRRLGFLSYCLLLSVCPVAALPSLLGSPSMLSRLVNDVGPCISPLSYLSLASGTCHTRHAHNVQGRTVRTFYASKEGAT